MSGQEMSPLPPHIIDDENKRKKKKQEEEKERDRKRPRIEIPLPPKEPEKTPDENPDGGTVIKIELGDDDSNG